MWIVLKGTNICRVTVLISIVFIFTISLLLLKLQAGEIEEVTKSLLQRNKARTKENITLDISKLEKALSKKYSDEQNKDVQYYEDNFGRFLAVLESYENEQAVRLGLDWEFYNRNIAWAFEASPAEYMSEELGYILIKNPSIIKKILEDNNQLGHEDLINDYDLGLASLEYYDKEQFENVDLQGLKRELKGWHIEPDDCKALEETLFAWIKTQNKYLSSELLSGAFNGNNNRVELLIKKGVNVDDKDINGSTALMGAAINGYIDTVKLLIDEKASIDVKDNEGNTALIYATIYGHRDIVKLLVEKKVDIHSKSNEGYTALNYAEKKGFEEIAAILRENNNSSPLK